MTSRAALLIVGSVALATTSVFAARWDPPFVEEPRHPGQVTIPPDLQLPTVDWTDWMEEPPFLGNYRPVTLDSHALMLDGREFARPSDPNAPFVFPSDDLAPPREDGSGAGLNEPLLFFDRRTAFAVVRSALRVLSGIVSLVVQRPNGYRGTLWILGTEHRSYHRGRVIHLKRGAITIDGQDIAPLPSGAADVATLRRTFRPVISPVIVPTDDTPLSDVVSVMVQYMPSEFTHPVVDLWPDETRFGPPVTEADLAADSRAMQRELIKGGRF